MEMGRATSKIAPWIDFVISGEADDIIVPLCNAILTKDDAQLLQMRNLSGVISNIDAGLTVSCERKVSRGRCRDVSSLPAPNYDEYFDELSISPFKDQVEPALLLESSRGCWWGQVSHCVFCGLNGKAMEFRSKDADTIVKEMMALVSKYNVRRIGFLDNILDHQWFKLVAPKLQEAKLDVELFYETKTNLRREEVAKLRELGVLCIQPGIESLSTEVLKLMGKGSTAIHGIQLLKWCSEFGIEVRWGFLAGFIDERDEWYEKMAKWLPLVFHLQPPQGFVQVEFHRFSPYHTRQEYFDLTLKPMAAYKYIYVGDENIISDLAYIFEDTSPNFFFERPGIIQIESLVKQWRETFKFDRDALYIEQHGDDLIVFDHRDCRSAATHILTGVEATLYRLADTAPPLTRLITETCEFHAVSVGEVQAKLQDLVLNHLVLEIDGRVVALATTREKTYPYNGKYAPYGRVRTPEEI
jgi:magnesium-protoporphyrin IX monomethyl ester (oxidative) cyclase